MMKTLVFLALFLVLIHPVALFSQITFEKVFEGYYDEQAACVQQTADGGYVIAGSSDPTGSGIMDFYLIKTDSEGNEEWSRLYGGFDYDDCNYVQQVSDGGYVLVGNTESFGSGGSDVYLVKTDASGYVEWSRTFGGSDNDYGRCVQYTQDGGYFIVGYTESYGYGSYDVYVIKTDSSGNVEWSRTYGGTEDDRAMSVIQTTDTGYVIVGYTYSFNVDARDVYLIKTDLNGVEEWSRTYGGSAYDYGWCVQQTVDGGYVITGYSNSFTAVDYDVYLIKTDSEGNEIWSRLLGGDGEDRGYSVCQTSDEGYVITGSTHSFGAGGYDVYLIKTDPNGIESWTQTFGGPRFDYGQCVRQTTDGGYIIAGHTEMTGGVYDIYLIKTNGNGDVGIESEGSITAGFPKVLALLPNYPNPFNPSTTISFEVPTNSAMKQHVTLAVYDMRGRLVRILVSSGIDPGNHKVTWNGKDESGNLVSSGIYLYQLKAGGGTVTRKMTVLK
jgi:hypothetical protein